MPAQVPLRDRVHAIPRTIIGVVLNAVGVKLIASKEFVASAVEGIGAALGGDVDDAAAGAPVLRVVEVGDDLELLRRVHSRNVGDILVAARALCVGIGDGIVRNAIEQPGVGLA